MPRVGLRRNFMAFRASIFLLLALTIVPFCSSKAQLPDLVVRVGDTAGTSGERNSVISVFLDRNIDTIAGFEIWLRLTRPDLIRFQTDTVTRFDTTYWDCTVPGVPNCLDSVAVQKTDPWDFFRVAQTQVAQGSISTAGSLIQSFEFIDARSLGGNGLDLKITALNDVQPVGNGPIGILPQSGGLLFSILADVNFVPDTLTDREVTVFPDVFLDNLNFSRRNGTSIGIITTTQPDSNFYRCTAYLPPGNTVCLNWQQVPGLPYDSVYVGLDTVSRLDTAKFKLFGGNFRVDPGGCGNVDADPLGEADILDLTVMVDYLFITFAPMPNPAAGNVDCDPNGDVDILDLTVFVDYLFITFTPFCCAP